MEQPWGTHKEFNLTTILVSRCYRIKYPQIQQLKLMSTCHLTISTGTQEGLSCVPLARVSHQTYLDACRFEWRCLKGANLNHSCGSSQEAQFLMLGALSRLPDKPHNLVAVLFQDKGCNDKSRQDASYGVFGPSSPNCLPALLLFSFGREAL